MARSRKHQRHFRMDEWNTKSGTSLGPCLGGYPEEGRHFTPHEISASPISRPWCARRHCITAVCVLSSPVEFPRASITASREECLPGNGVRGFFSLAPDSPSFFFLAALFTRRLQYFADSGSPRAKHPHSIGGASSRIAELYPILRLCEVLYITETQWTDFHLLWL